MINHHETTLSNIVKNHCQKSLNHCQQSLNNIVKNHQKHGQLSSNNVIKNRQNILSTIVKTNVTNYQKLMQTSFKQQIQTSSRIVIRGRSRCETEVRKFGLETRNSSNGYGTSNCCRKLPPNLRLKPRSLRNVNMFRKLREAETKQKKVWRRIRKNSSLASISISMSIRISISITCFWLVVACVFQTCFLRCFRTVVVKLVFWRVFALLCSDCFYDVFSHLCVADFVSDLCSHLCFPMCFWLCFALCFSDFVSDCFRCFLHEYNMCHNAMFSDFLIY
jgi:hypothetical protein